MYRPLVQTAGGAGAGSLAYTGFNSLGMVVAGLSLILLGLSLSRLFPRRRHENS